MTQSKVAIMLVDDHEVVRVGLRTLLDRRAGFAVVAEVGTVAEAVSAARETHPNVIVMDVRLPDGNGVEACREIRGELPETKVIMLTSYADDEAVYGRARVFIEATRSGGGTKLKVLNALARGLPVVCSPQAAEGIEAVPGEHLLVAQDEHAMAGHIARLLDDAALWLKLSESGRELIRSRYLAETAFAPLEEVLGGAAASA